MNVDNYARIGGFTVALALTGYLAVVQQSEQAVGALLGLLGLAGSFLYRGKVETPHQ